MGFEVAAVAPSPSSSSSSSLPSTSSRPDLGGCAGLARSRVPVSWGVGHVMPRRGLQRPARCALSASLMGMGGGDAEFLRRIEELSAAVGVQPAGCGWPATAGVERSASSAGMPLSLRMLKRKKQQQQQVARKPSLWDDGDERLLGSAGESVGRAFSSMVLIVRELQSFALQQMREAMQFDDLQGVLARVQGEMHASFVWLFQHIFAGTPALMVSLMLLLANFTVHSMGNNVAAAAAYMPPPLSSAAVVAMVDAQHDEPSRPRFDAATVKTFSVGRAASVGGGGGGGDKVRPVAGATGDGRWDEPLYHLSRVAPQQSAAPATTGAEKIAPDAAAEEEQAIWERMVAEASSMQANGRGEETSDPDVLGNLVAPVETELETEGHAEYARTEQTYERAVSEEPNNPLILANFAQFLYVVQNDHDRAEHYFERAVRAEPSDAEALSRYATFLWQARNDLGAAEETYQEAIAADPGNSHHAAAYAHFLWNTGGDDTCFPLD